MASDYHEGFFRTSSELKDLIFGSDALAWLAAKELQSISENPSYESPTWEPNYIVMGSGLQWRLRIGLYSRSSEFIYTMPQHMIVAVVGKQPLVADHYTIPAGIDIDKFDPEARLAFGVRHTHSPGDIVTIDCRREIFDVAIESPVLAVKLTSTPHFPLQWAFDRTSRRATQAIAANPIDSELVSMSRTLGAIGSPLAAPALSSLCGHPRHFVRWSAMQALGHTAPELLLPKLRIALKDPHPHVRAAARKALDLYQPRTKPCQ